MAGLNITTLNRKTEDSRSSQDISCVRLGKRVEAELLVDMVMGQIENIFQEAGAISLRDAEAELSNNVVVSSGAKKTKQHWC